MRYLTLAEIFKLHRSIIAQSGGGPGIRTLGSVQSALAQPHQAFGGTELYPTLIEKAAALCYSLVLNHPFVDGKKRIGHAAMETFLMLNGYELKTEVDDAEQMILSLAAGDVEREDFLKWVETHTIPLESDAEE